MKFAMDSLSMRAELTIYQVFVSCNPVVRPVCRYCTNLQKSISDGTVFTFLLAVVSAHGNISDMRLWLKYGKGLY